MFEDRKKFFSTKKLHALHPKLNVREDKYGGRDYVVFSNPDRDITANHFPEWPVGLDLWTVHEHEKSVDGKIFDPLHFYLDRRGLTEDLTGSVYGEIGTMTEVRTQHLYGGYVLEVIFGRWIKLPDGQYYFLVQTPYDIELALKNERAQDACFMVRVLHDKRKCAINGTIDESCSILYHRIQYANDKYRRYEFLVYPLLGITHSSRAQTISVEAYVHFYSAMYSSVIMLAHHERPK